MSYGSKHLFEYKGKPIVNSYHDGVEFEKKYGVKVF